MITFQLWEKYFHIPFMSSYGRYGSTELLVKLKRTFINETTTWDFTYPSSHILTSNEKISEIDTN